MDFDLCVPAYNEADIIEESLARICNALDRDNADWHIMLVDNASTDATGATIKALSHPRMSVHRMESKGKGAAIIHAAHKSTRSLFGFIDADLSADPSDILPLLALVRSGEADVVIGSRFLDTQLVKRGPLRSASSRIFNGFRRVLLGIDVVDSQCGLKVMNAKARGILRSCAETEWFLDLEFLARAERAGLRIREVPVHWDEYRFSNRQSKLRIIRDGFGGLVAMMRIRSRLADS